METVRRAALASSQPSAQDRQVAAEAQRKAQEAQRELREERQAAETTDRVASPAEKAAGHHQDGRPTDASVREPGAFLNPVV